LAARYGGEEFTLVLPGVALKGAEHVAHRILEALSTLALPHANSSISKFVTVSIGIGYFNKVPRNGAERDLLAAADKALYAAKSGGRAQAWAMDALETKTGQPESINEASLPGANGASAP
jgi:diguanylate cyclase (GGDEF)-like protein